MHVPMPVSKPMPMHGPTPGNGMQSMRYHRRIYLLALEREAARGIVTPPVMRIATRYCVEPTDPKEPPMNDPQCTQFLADIRKPLLALHKAILDHERAAYEKEFGPVTPAAFLQVLINGSGFRWLTPLSTVIASVDEILDDEEADAGDRLAAAEALVGLFSPDQPNNAFLPRYLPLLQADPAILHYHGQVAQLLRGVQAK